MKISQQIKSIINNAEAKFGVSEHNNDGISVSIFASPYDTFQVCLARPTEGQLSNGEVEDTSTIKASDSNVRLYAEKSTLTAALKELARQVEEAPFVEFEDLD